MCLQLYLQTQPFPPLFQSPGTPLVYVPMPGFETRCQQSSFLIAAPRGLFPQDSHRQRPSSLISSCASIASLPPCPQSMRLLHQPLCWASRAPGQCMVKLLLHMRLNSRDLTYPDIYVTLTTAVGRRCECSHFTEEQIEAQSTVSNMASVTV